MKIITAASILFSVVSVSFAQEAKPLIKFDQIFSPSQQQAMGLSKLSPKEKEALRAHIESMLVAVAKGKVQNSGKGGAYAAAGGGHWIKKNIDSGKYIVLEDGSLWEVDPMNKIDAMLWLPVSKISVVESTKGTPGYDYLLVNPDDRGAAHAKYLGKE